MALEPKFLQRVQAWLGKASVSCPACRKTMTATGNAVSLSVIPDYDGTEKTLPIVLPIEAAALLSVICTACGNTMLFDPTKIP